MRLHAKSRPVLITAAPRSRFEEARQRRRQYLVTMGVRVVCFLVAVIVHVAVIRIIAVVGACVLPYVAVVGANTVRAVRPSGDPSYFIPPPGNELEAGPSATPGARTTGARETVDH